VDDQDGKKHQGAKEKAINKVISLINPQRGREQSYDGAYPAGENYIAKEGRRLALLPRRPP
jgi:hypothetical protein